ncbi:hypothetical protein [Fulvivirga ligni]|uniref:hypothetical protein n=1 Tax=Fulvivirga ligni TaxID=2904246 RepID=UPI001F3EE06D|nr:hypothetical protein [Fulvivirga ligni]UII23395.1 hypothetical protein LVD16_09165 [Fulvivirga ligni]
MKKIFVAFALLFVSLFACKEEDEEINLYNVRIENKVDSDLNDVVVRFGSEKLDFDVVSSGVLTDYKSHSSQDYMEMDLMYKGREYFFKFQPIEFIDADVPAPFTTIVIISDEKGNGIDMYFEIRQ